MRNRTGRLSRHNQAGIISLVVTMIMMIVISLIILGFAQISRRESQLALDRQLSTQAYYAAETGVNDAKKAIIDSVNATGTIQPKDTCGPNSSYPESGVIDSDSQVEYTCLIVDTSLSELKADLKAGGDSESMPFEPAGGVSVDLKINWKSTLTVDSTTLGQCEAGIPSLTPPGGYFDRAGPGGWDCPYGVLRMDIVPTIALDRGSLLAGQKTVFFYPTRSGGSNILHSDLNGRVQSMNCQLATDCDVLIEDVPAGKFALRFNDIYQDGTVTVSALQPNTPTVVELNNSQILIDATGKARDVLRRIQVRLPLAKIGKVPDYPLISGSSICKRFNVQAPNISNSTGIIGQDQNNPMCAAFNSGPAPACVPTDIALVLDNSASLLAAWAPAPTRAAKLEEVATRFVNEVGISSDVYMGIVTFTSTAVLRQPLTNNLASLNTAISNMTYTPGTLYQDALNTARDSVLNGTRKKVMVFISDGQVDDQPTGPIEDVAIANAMKITHNVAIYTVGIIADPAMRQVLIDMSGNGGTYSDAATTADLDTAISNIVASIGCGGP